MQHIILIIAMMFASKSLLAQNSQAQKITTDSLLIIEKNPVKGFFSDYILFIPKGTKLNSKIFLLVEPNNTGKLSDSIEIHKQHAVSLASVSSVGNNISTELRIPLLVPVFPRLASKPLTYSHALDRDVMMDKSPELKRLDLQLIAMIEDSRAVLKSIGIEVEDKIFMSGFSASGTFVNRFSFLHPHKIRALAIGGFNGELILPQKSIKGIKINYPIGINDFEKMFKQKFDIDAYKAIPQYIYMGGLDDNDAVQFDDAYNNKERKIINEHIAPDVQKRYVACQDIYSNAKINATFKTYDKVGHWTTSSMNLDVIRFFLDQVKSVEPSK